MPKPIFRSESHALAPAASVVADVARTVTFYRRVVRAMVTLILTHPELADAKSPCFALEALFHATAKRPEVRYRVLDRICGNMPSYLRRAAVEAAYGVAASFLSNYDRWLTDTERERGTRPPRLGLSNVFPSLYGGNMILVGAGYRSVQVKLLGADGQWRFSAPLRVRGRFKRLDPARALAPSLVLRSKKVTLACPVKLRPPKYRKNPDIDRVCAVDVGINTAATAVVVTKAGTVIARTFITCGRHNDQRDRLGEAVAQRQSLTGSSRGLCRSLHRRIAGLSLDAARQMGAELVAFALKHGAQAFAFEALKGWRPKGPSQAQRKRFHRFQHRRLFACVELRAQELGLRMLEVYARGTSRWAYDGSGKVRRDPNNAQLATFSSGKQYNADLNGASNIAARAFAQLLDLPVSPGKSSDGTTRIPFVLADLWRLAAGGPGAALTASGASLDAPTTTALAV